MYERILIPTDGSGSARKASDHGLALASRLGARVTFLHVLENPLVTGYAAPEALPYSGQLYEDLKAAAEDVLNESVTRAREAGVEAEALLVENRRPVDAVHEVEENHDLVVMGTHGRRGMDRWMFGSVAEGALRRSRRPFLVIRAADEEDESADEDVSARAAPSR